MNELPKRLYILDFTRFVAAIAVVFWHWQHFATLKNTAFDLSTQPFFNIFKLFYSPSSERVAFFFMLSGFVFFWIYASKIFTTKVSFKKFMLARFARLYPLHLATLILTAVLQFIIFYKTSDYFVYRANDIYHFVLNLFFTSSWGLENAKSFNGPSWSVSIEILMYFIFFMLAKKGWLKIYLCLAISVLSFIWSYLFPTHPLFIGTTSFFLGGAMFYFFRNYSTKFAIIKYLVFAITIAAWILVFINLYFVNLAPLLLQNELIPFSLIVGFPIYIVLPFTVASLIFLEIGFVNKNSKIRYHLKKLVFLSNATYAIYLLHFPLQCVFSLAVAFGYLNANFYLNPWWFLTFFTMLFIMSYFVYKYFEMPLKQRINGFLD